MRRFSWLMLSLSIILFFLVALPMLFIVLQAIFPHFGAHSFQAPFSAFQQFFEQSEAWQPILNSIRLGISVVMISAIIGIPLGTLRGLCHLPCPQLWDVLFLIPFLIPPYIAALSWMTALQPSGYLSQLFGIQLGSALFSFTGMATIMGFSLFPLVYLAVSRSMASAGGRLADVARVCGATPIKAFFRVTLPLSLPAIGASLLLVFTLAIEEYGVPSALGSSVGLLMMTTMIERKLADWPIDLSGAAVHALMLVVIAMLAYYIQRRLTQNNNVETTTGKPVKTVNYALGIWKYPVYLILLLTVFVTIVIPIGSMVLSSISQTLSGGLHWDNITNNNYIQLFVHDSDAVSAIQNSLLLALGTAICAGVIGFLSAWCVTSQKVKGGIIIDILSLLPVCLPGIVVGVGLILLWNQPFWPVTIYGTWAILLFSYTCLLLPYPVRYVSAALKQLGQNLESAARVHGASTWATLSRITLPLITPSLFASMLIVFAIASRELVTSLLLAPAGFMTVSIFVWRQFEQGVIGQGMAMAVISIVISLACMLLGLYIQQRYQQKLER